MAPRPPRRLVAVIGDMVQSRALSARARASAQREFAKLIEMVNARFRAEIASQFVVTIGDEFQGLFREAAVIPDLIWTIEEHYAARQIRIGVGFGVLHTPIQKTALNLDGPVLHEARAAIDFAREKRLLGGVFRGFGAYDDVLVGYAQVLRHVRMGWTDKQREVVGLLRQGLTQTEAASPLGVTKQAVSDHAVSAGADAYRFGEIGWRKAIALATSKKGQSR